MNKHLVTVDVKLQNTQIVYTLRIVYIFVIKQILDNNKRGF